MIALSPDSTASKVLAVLQPYELKSESDTQWRCNSPLRPGSDSYSFKLEITGDEFGAFYDHVTGDKGSLYELAPKVGVLLPERAPVADTKRAYADLADYAAAHGLTRNELIAEGYSEKEIYQDRPALRFKTATGDYLRFIDGNHDKDHPAYKSTTKNYKRSWYNLESAIERAKATGQPLVICNGAISTTAAKKHGVAACAVTGGETGHIPPELIDELKAKYSGPIILAFDCDKAGRGTTAKKLTALTAAGFTVRAVDLLLGTKGDLCDFCMLYGEGSADRLLTLPAPKGDASRYELHTFEELLSRPRPAYVYNDLLPGQAVGMLTGASGAGKTFIALDIALRAAKTKNVIYVAAEGDGGIADRIAAWCNHNESTVGNFRVITAAVLLLQEKEEQAFTAATIPFKPDLIILDTLARCMLGGDENSARDAGLFIEACDRVKRATGATILLIHHTGKNGVGYRGSSAFYGAADFEISLSNEDGLISLSCTKSKDAEPFDTHYVRLIPVDARDGRQSQVAIPAINVKRTETDPLTKSQREILTFLSYETFSEVGAKSAQIKAAVTMHEKTFWRVLSELKTRKYIAQGKRGDPFVITADGMRVLADLPLSNSHESNKGSDESGEFYSLHSHTPLGVRVERVIQLYSEWEKLSPNDQNEFEKKLSGNELDALYAMIDQKAKAIA